MRQAEQARDTAATKLQSAERGRLARRGALELRVERRERANVLCRARSPAPRTVKMFDPALAAEDLGAAGCSALVAAGSRMVIAAIFGGGAAQKAAAHHFLFPAEGLVLA